MSRGYGSPVISLAIFLAILLIVLPVSAENVSATETAVPPTETTAVTTQTTVPPTETTAVTTQTTVPPTETTAATTVPTVTPSQTTPAPATTTVAVSPPTTVPATAKPVTSVTETVTTGTLNVFSSPAGAGILIDGIYSGTTPKTVQGVPAGNHILRLTLSGYYDYEGSVYVMPGQATQGYGTLQPINRAGPAVTATIPSVIVPVIVPVVTATPEPAQDPGLLGNPTVITAVIGAIAVIIGSATTIFRHVRPPKKE